jgi:hypothetical protein
LTYERREFFHIVISFVETRLFTRLVQAYLTDDDYARLQQMLADDPELGEVVPGTGGVRKVRWGVAGRGKRSGIRVIYFFRATQEEIWLLTPYAKNVVENIPAHILRQIRNEMDS